MQKSWKVILIVSIIINLTLGFILLSKPKNKKLDINTYTRKIDSLETELFIIQQTRDSIRNVIDTVIIEIDNNKKDYEEARDIILSNSTYEDYLFFTKYLNKGE